MDLRIESLTIKQFRALRQLSIDSLGRVNLITGRNNTGKSSVLEALRLLASSGSPSLIYDILRSREENVTETGELARPAEGLSLLALASLFHGFPPFSLQLEPLVIEATGGQRRMALSVEPGMVSPQEGPDGTTRFVLRQPGLFAEADALPALVIKADGTQRVMRLSSLTRSYRSLVPSYLPEGDARLPCVFVSPYGGERTATLGRLWDNIALSDREQDVVEALRIIDPDISAVSMIGGEETRQPRTAIVRASGIPRPMPLRSLGDGVNRLFGIVLSLVNAKDGLLLIDEFENGMHYSVQPDAWRVIFDLARRLDVQVFATSHSWDAVEAFQKVASQDPEKGVLIRLTRRGNNIVPTLFSEDELAVATRDRIEVR